MLTDEQYKVRLRAVQRENRLAVKRRWDKGYREAHREEIKAYQAKWRADHPDYFKDYHRNRRRRENERRNKQSSDDT